MVIRYVLVKDGRSDGQFTDVRLRAHLLRNVPNICGSKKYSKQTM